MRRALVFGLWILVALTSGCGDNSPVAPPLGLGLELEFRPHDAVIDTARSRLYVSQRLGASIVQIDYAAMRVVNRIDLSSSPRFMDLSDNGFGLELYVAVGGGISLYDATTLSAVGFLDTGFATSVVTDGRGRVFASTGPAYASGTGRASITTPFGIHARSDGRYIGGGGRRDHCRLRFLANGREIIGITTIVGPTDMEYYRLDSSGDFLMAMESSYHGDHPMDPRIYRASPGGQFVITSASGAIFTADSSMTYEGRLTDGSPGLSDFAFDASGSAIYAGVDAQRLVLVYEYPSLAITGEIATWGYPLFVFRDGDRLVCLSRSPAETQRVGVEVLLIP